METPTVLRDNQRCNNCGNWLAFAGFDKVGNRVLRCESSLTFYSEDEPIGMKRCDLQERLFVNGVEQKMFVWPKRARRDE